jgi:hypothetical protein
VPASPQCLASRGAGLEKFGLATLPVDCSQRRGLPSWISATTDRPSIVVGPVKRVPSCEGHGLVAHVAELTKGRTVLVMAHRLRHREARRSSCRHPRRSHRGDQQPRRPVDTHGWHLPWTRSAPEAGRGRERKQLKAVKILLPGTESQECERLRRYLAREEQLRGAHRPATSGWVMNRDAPEGAIPLASCWPLPLAGGRGIISP